jgi:hypothetical protein
VLADPAADDGLRRENPDTPPVPEQDALAAKGAFPASHV